MVFNGVSNILRDDGNTREVSVVGGISGVHTLREIFEGYNFNFSSCGMQVLGGRQWYSYGLFIVAVSSLCDGFNERKCFAQQVSSLGHFLRRSGE